MWYNVLNIENTPTDTRERNLGLFPLCVASFRYTFISTLYQCTFHYTVNTRTNRWH